jgi:hypothetical protein
MISQWRSTEAKGDERKLITHTDNARPQTDQLWCQFFQQNPMKAGPHPPSSPDLAPSDCYLFGYIKGYLTGFSFENADKLVARVRGVFRGIEKVTLRAAFLEWMERLRKCIATNGEYVKKSKIIMSE